MGRTTSVVAWRSSMFGTIRRARMTIGRRIYGLICLSFVGLLGVAFFESRELASSLDQQKQIELRHLGELALGIVKEEHAAAQKGGVSDADAQKRAMARIGALRYGNNDYFWINDMHPKMVMHPIKPEMNGNDLSTYKDPNGKLLFVDFVDAVKKSGSGFVPYEWPKPGFDKPQPKLSYVVGFAPWNWLVGTGVYIDDLKAQTWASTQRSLIVAGVILLLMLVVSIFVARSVTGPLRRMTAAMNDLASGNLAVEVPGVGRGDEVGEMAKAVEIFKSNAVARQSLEIEQRAAETRAVASRKSDMNKMADDFEAAVGRIVETVSSASGQLEVSAGTLTRPRSARRNSRPQSRRPPRKLPPTYNRWPPPPRRWPRPSARSAARCSNRRGWPMTPSIRRGSPTTASANCRRRQPASATSSN